MSRLSFIGIASALSFIGLSAHANQIDIWTIKDIPLYNGAGTFSGTFSCRVGGAECSGPFDFFVNGTSVPSTEFNTEHGAAYRQGGSYYMIIDSSDGYTLQFQADPSIALMGGWPVGTQSTIRSGYYAYGGRTLAGIEGYYGYATVTGVVPEPSSTVLMLSGVCALTGFVRRKFRA